MKKVTILSLCVFLILLFSPSLVLPAVRVHDRVAVQNQEIMLSAETRGRFFARGGILVQFSVDDTLIGNSLSGLDGFAFKSFTPKKQGLLEITARADEALGTGVILSLTKGSSIVFVDIEGCFFSNPFTKDSITVGREVISGIMKTYPLVYLQTGFLGTAPLREWLKKNDFPLSAVIPWKEGNVFSHLKQAGLSIKTVIGSRTVVESSDAFKPDTYVFDGIDDDTNIKKWKEIKEKIK